MAETLDFSLDGFKGKAIEIMLSRIYAGQDTRVSRKAITLAVLTNGIKNRTKQLQKHNLLIDGKE